MRQKSVHPESPSERVVKNVRRATHKRHSSEEKIHRAGWLAGRIQHCRGSLLRLVQGVPGGGKRRLAGDTARAATSGEVKDLRREAQERKAVAEQTVELRLLKKA
jgi:transposase